MNLYLLLPLASCIACASMAVGVVARDVSRRSSRLCALVGLCGAWWAGCELLWNTADDPDAALRILRLASFGWAFIGPVLVQLFLELKAHPLRDHRLLLPALYSIPLFVAVADQTTALVHTGMVRTSWGWGWEVGPVFALGYAFAAVTVMAALGIALRSPGSGASPAETRQRPWLIAGVTVPLTLASVTDGLAPLLGIQLPRLGASSITVVVLMIGGSIGRFGFTLLAPGGFASEILRSLRDGIAVLQVDGRIHSCNPSMGRLMGTTAARLEGRAFDELVDVDLQGRLSADHPRREDDVVELECVLRTVAGEPMPVSISTGPLHDKRGNAIGSVVVVRDLREITNLRSRLITSDRLAAVGQLAAGIAHEINNPIAYVRANLGTLTDLVGNVGSKLDAPARDQLADELSESQDLIEESLHGVERIVSIVRDVRGFAHSGDEPLVSVDLHEVLETSLRVAGPRLRGNASVLREFGPVPTVRGSPQRLQQVFLNLLINASHAVDSNADGQKEDPGEPREKIRVVTRREDERAIIEIWDHGCGIPPDQLEQVFDPFFTTKPVGEGTGLGLSISHQIVRSHGGELSAESSPECGTCFRVELPVEH